MTRPLPFAITLDVGSSRANHTGSWRTERPVYVHRLPPCASGCPAGEDPQAWLYHAESGDYSAAWRTIVEVNPFPAIMGRICYHPCEAVCNRAQLDEAVGINAVERFLGDLATAEGWELPGPGPDSGRRVLVVGSGPAGLAAAYHLRRLGHQVTVAESAERPGGMLRYGIPAYRLPRPVLDAELERILALGITLELEHRIDDVVAARERGGFDAVFLGVGAQLGRRVELPAGDSARILDAVALLHQVAAGEPPLLGRRVAVYGGGDTAIDAVRTARRLGATDAVIVYRRDRAHMPAHEDELEDALAEGVTTRWLSTIDALDGTAIHLERMRLDDHGLPVPTGEFEELDADAVVLAIGQDADLSLLSSLTDVTIEHGAITVDDALETGAPGIFAGGDAIASDRTATTAIGHGRRAALAIDAFLAGLEAPRPEPEAPASYERLNTVYYSDAPRQQRPELEAQRRRDTFDEVVGGLRTDNALFEARRCLSCGNCFECDNCYGVCPDNAVLKLGGDPPYAFDYDYCKGCGICAHECPCGAIEMIPERI